MLMPNFTANILVQSRALVRAIQAVELMETSNPLEREVAGLLRAALERQLLDIADRVSTWDVQKILSSTIDAIVH